MSLPAKTSRYLGLAGLALVLCVRAYEYRFPTDDSYVAFRTARMWVEHGAPEANPHSRVDAHTSFTWTALLAGAYALGIAPETAANWMGIVFGVLTILMTARLARLVRGRASPWDLVPCFLLTASAGFTAWLVGGMETPAFVFFVVAAWASAEDGAIAETGIAIALAVMTRPEGALLACVLLARLGPRRGLKMAAVALAIYLPYFVWHWRFYGDPLPNTFYAKVAVHGSADLAAARSHFGVRYVGRFLVESGVLFGAPLIALGSVRAPRFAASAISLAIMYLAYAIWIGGDFMGLGRFVLPVVPGLAVVVGCGAEQAYGWLRARARLAFAVVPLVLCSALFAVWQAHALAEGKRGWLDDGIARPGYLRDFARMHEVVGRALAPYVREGDVAIVGSAGELPYHARLPVAIDVHGLLSREIARELPAVGAWPGHYKFAPAAWLIERYHPTLILYCYRMAPQPIPEMPDSDCLEYLRHGYVPLIIRVPHALNGEWFTFLRH